MLQALNALISGNRYGKSLHSSIVGVAEIVSPILISRLTHFCISCLSIAFCFIFFNDSEIGGGLHSFSNFCFRVFSLSFIFIQELQLCRPRYDELISLQLRNIFVLISRAIMSAKKFSSTSEKEVAFAMHYFRKNYNTEISIEEYSESRGLSNCWFIQCFKEITGSSPLQYILKLRISNAQSLLENTYYTITEIANMVGYTNSLYFSRLFHKYIGMSPKEYRKVKLKENLRE